MLSFIEKVKSRFEKELPGDSSHQKLAPAHRVNANEYLKTVQDYKIGCVMALLYFDDNQELKIVLTVRAGGSSVHASQISFPGGKLEASDKNYLDAALRETFEEIGIERNEINTLGALSKLYIPPSNFLVYPYLGFLSKQPNYILSLNEVEKVISPSINLLKNKININEGIFESSRGYKVNAPYYQFEEYKIWGATAMMISEIIDLLA